MLRGEEKKPLWLSSCQTGTFLLLPNRAKSWENQECEETQLDCTGASGRGEARQRLLSSMTLWSQVTLPSLVTLLNPMTLWSPVTLLSLVTVLALVTVWSLVTLQHLETLLAHGRQSAAVADERGTNSGF